MRTRIAALLATLVAFAGVGLAAPQVAHASPTCTTAARIWLNSAHTSWTFGYIVWDKPTTSTRRPIQLGTSPGSAQPVRQFVFDQATSGTLEHRFIVNDDPDIPPSVLANVAWATHPASVSTVNVTVKTTGGSTLGNTIIHACP